MQQDIIAPAPDKMFNHPTLEGFKEYALQIFRYQYQTNEVYRNYCNALGKNPWAINDFYEIPFLPVSFFKTHKILCGNKHQAIFTSSTTGGGVPSKHFVKDVVLYEQSFRKGFEYFYGDVSQYCVLALLPSYLERTGSSLVYMAEDLVKRSSHNDSGFYMDNYPELAERLKLLIGKGQKILLLGVTYALLKLAEEYPMPLKDTIVMETGGMKGKRKELPRNEVHEILKKAFSIDKIHSEYGMTELLSQAYSKGDGIFNCPPWMRVIVRDIYDPFKMGLVNTSGGINIIDLANIHSCSFIATDDVGVTHADGSFEVAGRIDHSDIRGCNLMAEEL